VADDDHIRRPTLPAGAIPRAPYPRDAIDSVRMELLRQVADHRADVHMRLVDLRDDMRELKAGQAITAGATTDLASKFAEMRGGLSALKWILPISIGLTGGVVGFVMKMLERGHP